MSKPKVHFVGYAIAPSESDPEGLVDDVAACGRDDWQEADDRIAYVTCKQCLKALSAAPGGEQQ